VRQSVGLPDGIRITTHDGRLSKAEVYRLPERKAPKSLEVTTAECFHRERKNTVSEKDS